MRNAKRKKINCFAILLALCHNKQILYKFFGDGKLSILNLILQITINSIILGSVKQTLQNENTSSNVNDKHHSRSLRSLVRPIWKYLSCKKVQNEGANIPLLNGNDISKATIVSAQNGKLIFQFLKCVVAKFNQGQPHLC